MTRSTAARRAAGPGHDVPARRRRGQVLVMIAVACLAVIAVACGLVVHAQRASQAAATASGNAVVAGISALVSSQALVPALSAPVLRAPALSAPARAAAPGYPLTLTAKDRADCPPRATACVDLAEHLTWLQRDGKVSFGPVQMEPGPPGTPHATPAGDFFVSWKAGPGYISNIYHTPIPWAVFFAPGGIAFHAGSLTESSHGCVHLTLSNAHYYNEHLPVGAEVVVF